MKSLLNGEVHEQGRWIFNEDVDGEIDGPFTDRNYELLKTVLALPAKVHKHMEMLEASLALGEIMAVLKLVRCFFPRLRLVGDSAFHNVCFFCLCL